MALALTLSKPNGYLRPSCACILTSNTVAAALASLSRNGLSVATMGISGPSQRPAKALLSISRYQAATLLTRFKYSIERLQKRTIVL
jgi:hypothetical protein